MALAIFDLDETLISIDSDHAWGEYVADNGLVDAVSFRAENQRFYEDYKKGQLDATAYYEFSCRVLGQYPMDELLAHRSKFVQEIIEPHVLPKAKDLVATERELGKQLIIVTATMEFITRPIAQLFGIDALIAPTPEQQDGVYTGRLAGEPSFGPGKVSRLNEWLKETGLDLVGSRFYSDSHNDLPLLEAVSEAIAVDPDDKLKAVAAERGWSCISLR